MPPEGGRTTQCDTPVGKAAAQKKAAALKHAASIKMVSPTKRKSPVKEATLKKSSPAKKSSTEKASSPVKKATSPAKRASSPTKRASSPAKKTSSPAKKSLPSKKSSPSKRPGAYKTNMTRATRARNVAPEEASVVAPARGVKDVFQKRGRLGTNDNDDDPTQPSDEMLAAFDQRCLTEMDQFLIHDIAYMEEHETAGLVNSGSTLYREETKAESEGRPLDCHTKIYWRFLDLWARRHDGLYPQDYWQCGGLHIPPPPSPAKRPAKTVSRSPPKSPNATKAPSARRLAASQPKSPELQQTAISRPVRPVSTKASQSHSRTTSAQVVGASRIFKDKPAGTTKSVRPRAISRADVAEEVPCCDIDTETFLLSVENAAFDTLMAGKRSPLVLNKGLGVSRAEIYAAQERGRAKAILQKEKDNDVMMIDSEEDILPPSVINVGKQRASSRAQPPAKPHTHAGRQSPAMQPSVERVSSAALYITPVDPRRGHLVSSQNPAKIEVKNGKKVELQDNPFFESMPAPEVWHRRMPPVFPFGETPFMAKVVSDQINADLSRNHAEVDKTVPAPSAGMFSLSGVRQRLSSIAQAVSPTKATSSAPEKAKKVTSMWDLPEVDESYTQRVREVAETFRAANNAARRKRPATVDSHGPQKRPCGPRRGERPLYV